MDGNILDFDLLSRENRQRVWLWLKIGTATTWQWLPKRAMVWYGSALTGLLLVFAPINRQISPKVAIPLSLVGCALVAKSKEEISDLHQDITLEKRHKTLKIQLGSQSEETLEVSRHYTAVAKLQMQHNAELPDHMKEPAVVAPKSKQQEFEEFRQFMGLAPGAQLGDGSGDSVQVVGDKKYRFSTRKNKTTGSSERCVSLKGHDHWCGVPIEDITDAIVADDRGCLGFGTTGVGKSSLLEAIISKAYQADESTDFTAFLHKSANTARGEKLSYAGLEKTKDCYILTATQQGDNLIKAAASITTRIVQLKDLLEDGAAVPSYVIIDESNEGAKAFDDAADEWVEANTVIDDKGKTTKPNRPKWGDKYQRFTETLLVDGRSKGVKGIVFGHVTTNKSGIDREIRNQVFCLALGRNGIYGAIDSLLKDDRHIPDKAVRDGLRAQMSEYLELHNKAGSPVNVVICLTNAGSKGWRLIILPQKFEVVQIRPSVVNAPKGGTGLEPDTSNTPPVVSPHDEPPVDAAAEENPLIHFTAEQKQTAKDFVAWYRTNRKFIINSRGIMELSIAVECFDGVSSLSELEMVLEIIRLLGHGDFVTDPLDGRLAWRMGQGEVNPDYDRATPPHITSPQETSGLKIELPEGISEQAFDCFLGYLFNSKKGYSTTAANFLSNASKLRNEYKLKADDIAVLISLPALSKIVRIYPAAKFTFEFLGLPEDGQG